jgi:hypothetical protein
MSTPKNKKEECPNCGLSFAHGSVKCNYPDKSTSTPTSEKSKSECQHEIESNMCEPYCRKCLMRYPPEVKSEEKVCKYCNTENIHNRKSCFVCGADSSEVKPSKEWTCPCGKPAEEFDLCGSAECEEKYTSSEVKSTEKEDWAEKLKQEYLDYSDQAHYNSYLSPDEIANWWVEKIRKQKEETTEQFYYNRGFLDASQATKTLILEEVEKKLDEYSKLAVDSKDTKTLDENIGACKACGDILKVIKEGK